MTKCSNRNYLKETMNSKIGILPFQIEHQNDINAMMESIAFEFSAVSGIIT
jgi:hypothetical protein